MLLVTGGAGFIGSNVVASLNEAGRHDVAVSDWLGHDGKWRNLQKRQLADMVPPAELSRWLEGRKLDAVIHLGAISDTTATDGDAVMENNFRLSLRLLDWCTATRTPFIYASSAATYGDGEEGFSDGWSLAALQALQADESLRLEQASVRSRACGSRRAQGEDAAAMGGLQVLQRVRPERIPQGRDDEPCGEDASTTPRPASRSACSSRIATASRTASRSAISSTSTMRSRSCAGCWRRRRSTGIFNVGTGQARSFKDLIGAMYRGARPRSRTSNTSTCRPRSATPTSISRRAEVANLQRAGYNAGFAPLEDSVRRYVTQFLDREDRYR